MTAGILWGPLPASTEEAYLLVLDQQVPKLAGYRMAISY